MVFNKVFCGPPELLQTMKRALTMCSPTYPEKLTTVCATDISDHFGVLHQTNFPMENKTQFQQTYCYRSLGKMISNNDHCCKFLFKLQHDLQQIDYENTGVEELFEKYLQTLKTNFDFYFPVKTAAQE